MKEDITSNSAKSSIVWNKFAAAASAIDRPEITQILSECPDFHQEPGRIK